LPNQFSSHIYARYASVITADEIPADVREILRYVLLDAIGTGAAASSLGEGCKASVDYALAHLGTGEAPLLGLIATGSPAAAAFANGALVHALNFDAGGLGHIGAIVPTALAAVEACAGRVSGRDFLCGLTVGAELLARIAQSLKAGGHGVARRTLDGQIHGYFGCAATAARILDLTSDQFHDALGLALMQAAGTMQIVIDGDPPAKAIYAAFANQGGLQAALLARSGVGAYCNVFDGEAGLFQLFYQSDCSLNALTNLGEEYYLRLIRFKPWPTSGLLHPLIKTAICLKAEHDLVAGNIASVAINAAAEHRAWFEPVDKRTAPANAATAANSGQFAVAKALVHGKVDLGDFSPAGLRDPDTLALAKRMKVHFWDKEEESIVVTTSAGQSFQAPAIPIGPLAHALTATSSEALQVKFRHCLSFAANEALSTRADAIIKIIAHLEEVNDMKELTQLLREAYRSDASSGAPRRTSPR